MSPVPIGHIHSAETIVSIKKNNWDFKAKMKIATSYVIYFVA